MTEEEWLAATEPTAMLEFREGKATDRKFRMFGIACCRRVALHLTDPRSQKALELAERAADGGGLSRQLKRAHADLTNIIDELERRHGEFGWHSDDQWFPTRAVCCLYSNEGFGPVSRMRWVCNRIVEFVRVTSLSEYAERDIETEYSVMSELLREIFGNPFRPVTFDPAWRTSTAVAVAETIYADRTFGDLPVLADALQDAGCEHADILSHLRGPGPHVRGCWALDLVLGKE